MEIIQLTGKVAFYRKHILAAAAQITGETDDRDATHLIRLTAKFAEQGDAEAKAVLYDVFTRNLKDSDPVGAREIIHLDKVAGFVFVADKIGALWRNDPDPVIWDHLLFVLEDEIGERPAREILDFERTQNPNVDFYLGLIDAQRQRRIANPRREIAVETLSFAEVKTAIDNTKHIHFQLWGKSADKKNLLLAANALLQEHDHRRIWQYLKIFLRTPFPLNPELLIPLVDIEHAYIPYATLGVLEQISHPAIRAFALQRIADGNMAEYVIGLLARNFEADDWQMMEAMSAKFDDDDRYHAFTRNVRDIFEENPDPLARQTLLKVYENTPCSFCRERIVWMLHSLRALTADIREECLYDSNLDLRQLAKYDFHFVTWE